MTDDQAKTRTALYGLLVCSILISLISMFLSWQQTAYRNRRSEEIRLELTKLEKKLEELEAPWLSVCFAARVYLANNADWVQAEGVPAYHARFEGSA